MAVIRNLNYKGEKVLKTFTKETDTNIRPLFKDWENLTENFQHF